MDTTRSAVLRETIRKEMRMNSKHLDEMRRKKGLPLTSSAVVLPPIQKQSCSDRQMDQTMGLTRDPHTMTKDELAHHSMTADDLFKWGVSHEGQGRYAYLKHQVKNGGPRERFGHPILASHEIGWATLTHQNFGTSPHAKRPLVKNQFYRTMGVSFSTGAL